MSRKPHSAKQPFHFEGFSQPTTTAVPDELFDRLLPMLSGAELKALLYIVRRTFGFKRSCDPISYSQFLKGITKRDGTVLDGGCGIRSRTTLSRALESLEEKGIIQTLKQTDEKGDRQITIYQLRFRGQPEGVVQKVDQGSPINGQGAGTAAGPGLVRKVDPQQAVKQQTVKQQTEKEVETSSVRKVSKPADAYQDPDRQVLGELVADFSRLLGDTAPVASSASRAYNLYQDSGLDLRGFTDRMYEARAITQERSATITSEADDATLGARRKTKMGYFFAVLQDRLELHNRE